MSITRGHLTLAVVSALLLAACVIPFFVWGEQLEGALSLEGARDWMGGFGHAAGLAGVGLLIADILLPIPSTVVMSALGLTYGTLIGGLYAGLGSMLSGLVAYAACRWLGRPAALRIAGEDGLRQGEAFFENGGAWLVLTSRWLPVLPEAVACLAGLVRMPFRTFVLALACGCLPMGFAFAAIGAIGRDNPGLALGLSIAGPVVLWLAARRWLRR